MAKMTAAAAPTEMPIICGVVRESSEFASSVTPPLGGGADGSSVAGWESVSVDDGWATVVRVVELVVEEMEDEDSERVEVLRVVETEVEDLVTEAEVLVVDEKLLVVVVVVSSGGSVTAPVPEGGSTTVAVMTVCVG
jgi:hypothetical protein